MSSQGPGRAANDTMLRGAVKTRFGATSLTSQTRRTGCVSCRVGGSRRRRVAGRDLFLADDQRDDLVLDAVDGAEVDLLRELRGAVLHRPHAVHHETKLAVERVVRGADLRRPRPDD